MKNIFPENINQWLHDVVEHEPRISEIWFIGSRANGVHRPDSDWDFLAFGTSTTLESLRRHPELNRSDVDFLVLTDGNNFESVWGRAKKGSLISWNWSQTHSNKATYLGEKLLQEEQDPDENAPYDLSTLCHNITTKCIGYRVWPLL